MSGTSFNASVQLSGAGARELEIQVVDAAGNTTTTPLNLFADITKPAITQFLNLPETPTLNPVNYVDVKFSEQINLSTFDRSDITLTRNGETVTLPNTVTIEYLSDTTYRINGLDNLTNTPGNYQLRVDATTIQDNAGNNGDIARTASFTISAPVTPGVTFTQTNGSTTVTEAGNSDTYTLFLRTQPTSDVTITLAPGNQITSDKTTLTFTATNWNVPQTITITAVNDTTPEGDHISTITHSISSNDGNYNSLTLPNINIAIQDNDVEIRGVVWNDVNGNSIKDSGESLLTGWTVYLDTNNNSQLDAGETSTLTDSQGNYTFNDLRPGTYNVAQVVQDGWKQTYPVINVTTTASTAEIFTPSAPLSTTSNTQATTATNLINLDGFVADTRFTNIKGQGYATVIIDTGADLDHPLFGADNNGDGIADRIIYQYDFADKDNNASDKSGHGSHIASIAASIAPGANIIILKVFKDSGSGSFSDLEAALQWVNQNADKYNIASVNLSVGDGQNWSTGNSRYGIGDELAAIASKNIIVAAAAGNSFYQFNSNPGLAYPAADPNTIAVGAVWADNFSANKTFGGGATDNTTDSDRIASFSQRHATLLDVLAPGIFITGANATGGTQTMGGTSQAVPFISGIAVLAQQIATEKLGRQLTLTEFRTLLDNTSVLINDGDNENDNVNNTGLNFPRVNMLALAEGILKLNSQTTTSGNSNPNANSSDDPLYLPSGSTKLNHTVTLTAGQIANDINFGNQLINKAPTLTNISKSGNENTVINFSQTDFTTAFNDADGNSLNKIQILSLPNNGVLQLNGTNVVLNQEVTLANLNNLTFTPNPNFDGIVSFNWNGFDGEVYALNPASINLTVLNVINGTSNSETINGTNRNDVIDGGAGNDRLVGGLGDDIYIVDSSRDVVVEAPSEGKDTVKSAANYTLTNNIEDLVLTGASNISGTGNDLDNTITGNSGNNTLKGLGGNDILLGGAGSDILVGGAGNDILTGGADADQFLFGSGAAFNTNAFGVDTITDFNKAADKIVLSKASFTALSSAVNTSLAVNEFATIQTNLANEVSIAGGSGAKIVYNSTTGNLLYNQDGTAAGLGSGGLFATFTTLTNVESNNFFVQA
ncbi:hypothetical protein CAL7716_079490 [Calothrix sp. PCC 7716]|nr:hypothetical protein CAL7716_079490 [Calothrix sp. PCC 7716]